MTRLRWFLGGVLTGIVCVGAVLVLQLIFLADFLVVDSEPQPADAIVILGGDVTRLKPGLRLFDQGLAPRLLLTGSRKDNWLRAAQKHCPECRLEERPAVFLEKSTDTRTDAQISLQYCLDNDLKQILVVTSPYHTRRSRFVFNDVFEGSGVKPIVISSGDYGHYLPPDGPWWHNRQTIEVIWLEFGKILFWELTPYSELEREDLSLK